MRSRGGVGLSREGDSSDMNRRDDLNPDRHHFWTHFAFGLVFGGAVCAWTSLQIFETRASVLTSASIATLAVAYCCGRWGDSAWHWLAHVSRWWV